MMNFVSPRNSGHVSDISRGNGALVPDKEISIHGHIDGRAILVEFIRFISDRWDAANR